MELDVYLAKMNSTKNIEESVITSVMAMCFVCWGDNNVVTCGSNYDTVLPVVKVERHVKRSMDKQKVPQSQMISNYVSGMQGGVNLMDSLLSSYRPRIKSKKWWCNLFINAINIAVVVAWKVHCKVQHSSLVIGHLEFRREIAIGLLKKSSRHRLGGPLAFVPSLVRFDGAEHYIESTTQGRCAECGKILRNSV